MERYVVEAQRVRVWIKRSTYDTYAMMLRAAKVQEEVEGEARPTTVSFSTRSSYNRAKKHIRDLEQLGLLESEQKPHYITLKVTDKGRKFIELYDQMQELLGRRRAVGEWIIPVKDERSSE